MGWFGSGAKTYEMPANTTLTPGIFTRDSFARIAPSLEGHVGHVDATLVLGNGSYRVSHVIKSDLGYRSWQAEVSGKPCEDLDRVVAAIVSLFGRRGEPKTEPSGDETKVTVSLHPDTDLSGVLTAMNKYAAKAEGAVFVSGYGFIDIKPKLAEQLIALGLPLQEVKSK